MAEEDQTRSGRMANSTGILWMVGLGIIVVGIFMAFCTGVTGPADNSNSVNGSPRPTAGP